MLKRLQNAKKVSALNISKEQPSVNSIRSSPKLDQFNLIKSSGITSEHADIKKIILQDPI